MTAREKQRVMLNCDAMAKEYSCYWYYARGASFCMGRLLTGDNAFPITLRPNRHHRRRFKADRPFKSVVSRDKETGRVTDAWGYAATITKLH